MTHEDTRGHTWTHEDELSDHAVEAWCRREECEAEVDDDLRVGGVRLWRCLRVTMAWISGWANGRWTVTALV